VDRGVERSRIVAVHVRNDVPAIGGKAGRRVVGEPAFHMAVDRNAVVVVERDQLGKAQRASQRASLMADAFHHAAVPQEGVGEVVDDVVTRTVFLAVELGRQQLLGQRHAHCVADALAERAGGGFHAGRDAELRVAGGLAVQLPELLQLVHGQVVAGKVQQRVDQHRAVAVAQHKSVTVRPVRDWPGCA
jgi:hypothetical protein